ncbi:MAG TPA: BON domain-containing protein [Steroidobacteraceae bacterium]|jgi:osmotically-inducible protein OsmY|nr:BON domain-containing protein [Steroidobacteraceae bacterium]
MSKTKSPISLALICIIVAGLAGCASFDKCSPENCATDAQINKDVFALLEDHPEFGAPGRFHVQTINGVVYLNGTVNSDFEVRNMEALVRRLSDVKDVVNNLNPRGNTR